LYDEALKKMTFIAIIAVFTAFILLCGCTRSGRDGADMQQPQKSDLIIFHAGSLSLPLKHVSDIFEKQYPDVTVKAVAAGSLQCARNITDLDNRCDILAVADYGIIDNLLFPDYADFNIHFAVNEMVIAFTKNSRSSDMINSDNWYELLLQEDIDFGRSNPDLDPCGYRTLMVFQLAEKFYQLPGIAEKIEKKGGDKFIRPKETDLLSLLETGEIDYLFIYKSVAVQHNLLYIELPTEINLSSPLLKDLYKTAIVTVTGRKPGEHILKFGSPIVYSVTIPHNSENKEYAEKFIDLLLSTEGQEIFHRMGQPPITPALCAETDKLPALLKTGLINPMESQKIE
jgi:molybdate/tungstate transport system substrate-binding protein